MGIKTACSFISNSKRTSVNISNSRLKNMKKFAVILAGCGRKDGSEINEARFMKLVGGADLLTLNRLKDSTARNKDFAYAYAILKLYNKIGGKAALSPYALYEHKH